jgi:hypothetical protein
MEPQASFRNGRWLLWLKISSLSDPQRLLTYHHVVACLFSFFLEVSVGSTIDLFVLLGLLLAMVVKDRPNRIFP